MSDEDIIALLTDFGIALDDWFIAGGAPAHTSEIGIYGALLIEDDAALEACLAFLRRRGAKEYTSVEDVIRAGLANTTWL